MTKTLARVATLSAVLAAALPAAASATPPVGPPAPTTIGVFGDTPYGAKLVPNFHNDVDVINGDASLSTLIHLGDIKDGKSVCSNDYFDLIRAQFDRFTKPLVYTPGDNEWTDCHRANNGGYNPVERLDRIRAQFIPHPGTTLGAPMPVAYQSDEFPENVRWEQSGVELGVVHLPGSNNGTVPWFTDRVDATGKPVPQTPAESKQQEDEVEARSAADLAWINRIFAAAERTHAAAVLLGLQADTWSDGDPTDQYAPFIRRIAQRAHDFRKPVLLLEGDSHIYKWDHPLANGSKRFGVAIAAPNLTRVIVQGSTNCPHEYLRLKIDASTPAVFDWENVLLPAAAQCPNSTAPSPKGNESPMLNP